MQKMLKYLQKSQRLCSLLDHSVVNKRQSRLRPLY